MKKLLAFMGLIGLFHKGKAQTFAEWFEQNKTQLKYLRVQLLALQAQEEGLEEGFAIDEEGLGRIGGDKQTDFNLHAYYFSMLTEVNPIVAANPRVARIITLTDETIQLSERLRQSSQLFPRLKTSLDALCNNIDETCENVLLTLADILQDGRLQLTDSERWERVNKLYGEAEKLNKVALRGWEDADLFSSIHKLCESSSPSC